MASASVLDRKVARPVHDLHDLLWTGAKHDEATVLRRLADGAKVLDAHLQARVVLRSIRPILTRFDRRASGADLFTFLWILGNLAVAGAVRRTDPKEAARRASEVVVSNSIHLASAAGHFHLVEAFEGGKSDFDAFQEGLEDVLENRGVLPAREMHRLAVAVYDRNATWKSERPKEFQRIAASAVLGNAALHSALLPDALRALGRYRDAPYAGLAPALRRILDGGRAHA